MRFLERGYEVAEAGEAGEGAGVGAHGGAEAGDFGEASGDEGGEGVFAESVAGGHAASEGDDVFAGAADFGADNIGVGVGAEVGGADGCLDLFGAVFVGAGDDGGGGLLEGDFFSEVGAGEDGDAAGVGAGDVGDDLAHAEEGVGFDAFGEADEGGVCGDVGCPGGEIVSEGLAGYCEDDDGGAGQGVGGVGGGGEGGG